MVPKFRAFYTFFIFWCFRLSDILNLVNDTFWLVDDKAVLATDLVKNVRVLGSLNVLVVRTFW